jgi:glycerol-3-phosphate acyltransferase PlsX
LVRIAIDAMGGDYAPTEIIKGAVEAAKLYPVSIILVGDEKELLRQLSKYKDVESISIVHASQVINMDDPPASAVKQKKDSSINVAVKLVASGRADAVISAGNTGALMASALFGLGRIKGVERPAIATIFPTPGKPVLLLDMGANVDCKPKHLKQFAEMGSLYAEHIMHVQNPRVGLLNIGEEETKGNELAVEAYQLLKQSKINFVGNVESKEIFAGKVDVFVCDGFIGNLLLKFAENIGQTVMGLIRKELLKNPISILGALLLAPGIRSLKKTMEYDEYGAAPLLGLDGVCFKAHGRAKARAITNAIRVTHEAVKERIVHYISLVEGEEK